MFLGNRDINKKQMYTNQQLYIIYSYRSHLFAYVILRVLHLLLSLVFIIE